MFKSGKNKRTTDANRGRHLVLRGAAAAVLAGLLLGGGVPSAFAAGTWMSGEYHTHTGMSKDATEQYMGLQNSLAAAFRNQDVLKSLEASTPATHVDAIRYGKPYDYLFFADHLRRSSTDMTKGGGDYNVPFYKAVQEQQKSLSQALSSTYKGKITYSGFEWDMPGLDHASVGLIQKDSNEVPVEGIHEFEWKYAHATNGDDATSAFDNNGAAEKQQWGDRLGDSNVEHAYEGAAWIAQNYPDSYLLPNHISRHGYSGNGAVTIENLRRLNDAAPNNVFGFEGLPGNQMSGSKRGELPESFAGADKAIAQTGGVWDSLLAEGRHMWTFANADFHFKVSSNGNYSSGYWPSEYSRNYTYVNDAKGDGYDVHDVVAGLRSGNSFSTQGDIIDALDFTATSNGKSATMGETLAATKSDPVTITIRFRVPAHNNYKKIGSTNTGIAASDTPHVDHIDLIRGSVTGKVAEDQYGSTANTDAKIIKTFSGDELGKPDAEGYYTVTFQDTADHAVYYRLRGVSTSDVDKNGDPVADKQFDQEKDNAKRMDEINDQNYAVYSFYANPVFVNAAAADTSYDQVRASLQAAVADFDKADAKAYTPTSYAAWKSAVDAARELLGQLAPGRDAMSAALAKATTAKQALKPAASENKPGGNEGGQGGNGGTTTPGGNQGGSGDGGKQPEGGTDTGADKKPSGNADDGDKGGTDKKPAADTSKKQSGNATKKGKLPKTSDDSAATIMTVMVAGGVLVAAGAASRRFGHRGE